MGKRASALPALLVVVATAAVFAVAAPSASAWRPANCAKFGNTIDFDLHGDLRVSEHGSKCLITGTVRGNVKVVDHSTICDPPPAGVGQTAAQLTAVNAVGGRVLGNITAQGGRCAMVWLREGAEVGGNVIYSAQGNLGFLDAPDFAEHIGSTVHGNVILRGGLLWATSTATDNRVDGHIICNGGAPRGPSGTGELGSGSATDWDGFESDVDGTIGGRYLCGQTKSVQHTPMRWHAQSGHTHLSEVGPGARAKLTRTASGISYSIHTRGLNPGHAYTVWVVVINDPAACSGTPCTPADILTNPETESQVTYGTGHVAGSGGIGGFGGHLAAGPLPAGWLPHQGLDDPLGAEIHLVLNDHGPKLADYMPGMIRTYRAGCTDESLPAIFPTSAKADGEPGPNTCRLWQVAVFE
jgi:hypothetical protein